MGFVMVIVHIVIQIRSGVSCTEGIASLLPPFSVLILGLGTLGVHIGLLSYFYMQMMNNYQAKL